VTGGVRAYGRMGVWAYGRMGVWAYGRIGVSAYRRMGETPTGGEPLLNARKDLALFFPGRGRPNKVLNRRLPETTAGDVLPSAPFGDSSSAQRAERPNPHSKVRGSPLFDKIWGLHAPRQISRGLKTRSKAAPLQSAFRPFAHSPTRRYALTPPVSWILAPVSFPLNSSPLHAIICPLD
jgi:hypothetical protein